MSPQLNEMVQAWRIDNLTGSKPNGRHLNW